ncbi:MAG TPA: VOC family protein [Actinomycetota bacterium]|nr:VOC family protein [Actinomycetota bacterium]
MAFQGLKTIGQIHVSVTDVDRAVEFYRDVLGLPFTARIPGQPMAFFDCDGISLYLGVPETEAYRSRGMIYFSVPDVDEAYATLSERGVSFLDAPHVVHREATWELRMAFFTDEDGNNLALMAEVPIAQTVG